LRQERQVCFFAEKVKNSRVAKFLSRRVTQDADRVAKFLSRRVTQDADRVAKFLSRRVTRDVALFRKNQRENQSYDMSLSDQP